MAVLWIGIFLVILYRDHLPDISKVASSQRTFPFNPMSESFQDILSFDQVKKDSLDFLQHLKDNFLPQEANREVLDGEDSRKVDILVDEGDTHQIEDHSQEGRK